MGKKQNIATYNETVSANPQHIWIEPTTRCNIRCIHCAHYYSDFGVEMSPELYAKISKGIFNDVKSVEIIGYGEPLFSKIFFTAFDDCVALNLKILTTTNGLLLKKNDIIKKIVRNDVDLCLSIDGACAEVYEMVRPGIKWGKIIEILELIKKSADEAGSEKRFGFRFNFAAMKMNIADLPNLVMLAHKYGAKEIYVLTLGGSDIFEKIKDQSLENAPELTIESYLKALSFASKYNIKLNVPPSIRKMLLTQIKRDTTFSSKLSHLKKLFFLSRLYIAKGALYKRISGALSRKYSKSSPIGGEFCSMPWNDTYFAASGRVFVCCMNGEPLGDFNTQSWDEIWNGAQYKNIRRTIHSWNPTQVCRFCSLPSGINGGDDKRYKKYFSKFKSEEIPINSPHVNFSGGFYALEMKPDGAPSHRWMSKNGVVKIAKHGNAKFLRLTICPRFPNSIVNPGYCVINNELTEPFDNSCDEIVFPIDNITKETIELNLTSENTFKVGDDTRELSYPIFKIEILR